MRGGDISAGYGFGFGGWEVGWFRGWLSTRAWGYELSGGMQVHGMRSHYEGLESLVSLSTFDITLPSERGSESDIMLGVNATLE